MADAALCRADDSTEGAERPIVAIENVAVVDVVQGRIAGPRTVLIVAGRIAALGEPGAVALPPAAVRMDGREHYLVPGLVDMNQLGCRWRPSVKGPGSRIAGKSAIHARLALRADGKPGMVVFRTCANLIRTLPGLPFDKHNVEDIAQNVEDHPVEALRIGLTRKSSRTYMIRLGGV